MKIIADNVIYVQKNDLAYLNHTELPIPASIATIVYDKCSVVDDNNRYEFITFNKPEEIAYFKNLDWIIDYNEVKDLSKEQIITLAKSIAEEKNSIAESFNSMSKETKKANLHMVVKCDLLGFKLYSLGDFIRLKEGRLNMPLPDGVDLPLSFTEEKGVRHLIRSLLLRKSVK